MIYEPIIKAHQKKFVESFDLKKCSDSEAFEKFANYTELLQHQPDAFSSDMELLDTVSIGGGNDGGIDGIALKVNNYLIKTQDEIDEFLKKGPLEIELIFIQAKNTKNFDSQELGSFISGVRAFFDSESTYPFNEQVQFWRTLCNYLYSEDVMLQWKVEPIIRCYYVTLGEYREHEQHNDQVRTFKKDMANYCETLIFHFQGAKEFKSVIEQNQNKFKSKLPYIDTMELPGTNEVGNSCVVLCHAKDFVSMINTDDGIIRKTLFNDNVRDFQGDNSINSEIAETIKSMPERFVLFNNGITIVCSSFVQGNRLLEIENPQIVNGCQSSYLLFNANKQKMDLSKISIVVKIISTNNSDLSNEIVRGTNRQNIVMEEAFECTRQFHKNFEQFVNDYVADFPDKIYYERRAKQYADNPNIKQYQKFNLHNLTQFYVGAILQHPEKAHLHESYLLKKYRSQIFCDKHSNLPYFAVAYTFLTLEKLIREKTITNYFIKYKAHLLMIYFRLLGGKKIDMTNERAADKYAQNILKGTYKIEDAKVNFEKAIEVFRNCEKYWTQNLHKSPHLMKEAQIFTELIIKMMDGITLEPLRQELQKLTSVRQGVVKRIFYSGGRPFGFISSENGEEVFFSSRRNPNLKFKTLKDKKVEFNATLKDGKDRMQAYNIKVLS